MWFLQGLLFGTRVVLESKSQEPFCWLYEKQKRASYQLPGPAIFQVRFVPSDLKNWQNLLKCQNPMPMLLQHFKIALCMEEEEMLINQPLFCPFRSPEYPLVDERCSLSFLCAMYLITEHTAVRALS